MLRAPVSLFCCTLWHLLPFCLCHSCAGLDTCLSSFDDRPGHFIAPWTFDNGSRHEAVQQLVNAVREAGGVVQEVTDGDRYGYVYATFEGGPLQGVDDVELLLPDGDTTVRPGLDSISMLL
mgnify:CR=1 FL=1